MGTQSNFNLNDASLLILWQWTPPAGGQLDFVGSLLSNAVWPVTLLVIMLGVATRQPQTAARCGVP
jgi:hypothetical protein